jgi:hypothetical protein
VKAHAGSPAGRPVVPELLAEQASDLRIDLDGIDVPSAEAPGARISMPPPAPRTSTVRGRDAIREGGSSPRETPGAHRRRAAVTACMLSPSMKIPSCAGGSLEELRLRPGAERRGTRGLSITSMRPSGLDRSSITRVPSISSAWLRPL